MSFLKKFGKGNNLSTKVQEFKKSRHAGIYNFKKIIKELYVPSFYNLLIVCLFIVLVLFIPPILYSFIRFLFISNDHSFYIFCQNLVFTFQSISISNESNFYQNLIAVLAGISAIIFALVIFIAESSRESEKSEEMRVLLKQSYLYPLVIFAIVTFIILLVGLGNWPTVILIILLGVFTILSVKNIISVLLSKSLFFEKETELLNDRLRSHINNEIDKRIGNNILISEIKRQDIKIDFSPSEPSNDKSESMCFCADRSGIVVDIDLDKLKKFGELLEEQAHLSGYSFYKSSYKKDYTKEQIEVPSKRELNEDRKRYIVKGFLLTVEKGDPLIVFDKFLLKDDKKLKELQALSRKIFAIALRKTSNSSEDIRREIENVADRFVGAVREHQHPALKDLSEIYISFIETFWDCLKEYGTYSYEEADIELHSLFGGWKELDWITEDYRRFLKEAVETNDFETIDNVFYLSIAIAQRSIDHKDQLIFQEFMQFAPILYIYADSLKKKELKESVVKQLCEYLTDLANFYISYRFDNERVDLNDLTVFKDFAIYLLFVFQNLLKYAFDKADLEAFVKFQNATEELFGPLFLGTRRNVELIKSELENKDLPESEREILERQKKLQEAKDEIEQKRQQMFTGLASWIFNKLSMDRENTKLKSFFDSVVKAITDDIGKFTEIVFNASVGYWGWDFWETNELKKGQAHFIDFDSKLWKFFIVKALMVLSSKSEEEIGKIVLPYDRKFATLINDKKSAINVTLESIESDPNDWYFVLSNEAISKAHSLRELLAKVAKEQEETELEEIIKNKISTKKVNEFEDEVVESFYESANLRNIMKYYNLYRDKTNEFATDDKHKFGFFDYLTDKAAFFEDWYTYYLDWGKSYGRGLGLSENNYLLDQISSSCKKIDKNNFKEVLDDFEAKKNVVIISTNISKSWEFFEETKNFIPEWYKNSKEYKDMATISLTGWEGWYKCGTDIPVFSVYNGNDTNSILILDVSKLGYLIQYSPLKSDEESKFLKDIFFMNIVPLSEREDLLRKIISAKPGWLIQKTADEEKQIKYLKTLAVLNIYEGLEFCKSEDFTGYILTLE